MVDRRYTQTSQSSRGGRAASLVIVALLLIALIAACSTGGAALKERIALGSLPSQEVTVGGHYDARFSATGETAPYTLGLQRGAR